MAMSSSERLRLMMEQNKRFVGLNKTRDQSERTLMVQARSSQVIFNRSSPMRSIPVTKTYTKGIPNNGIGSSSNTTGCAFQFVTSGSETFNERDAIAFDKQGCALCENPSYSANQNVAIDLTTLGQACCIDKTKPPFSQDIGSLTGNPGLLPKCKICGTQYFPSPSQPTAACCTDTVGSMIDMKFGAAGVPQRGAAAVK